MWKALLAVAAVTLLLLGSIASADEVSAQERTAIYLAEHKLAEARKVDRLRGDTTRQERAAKREALKPKDPRTRRKLQRLLRGI